MTNLEKLIDENCVGDDEWWKSASQNKFYNAGKLLVTMGMTETDAAEELGELYAAVADCYGD